MHKKTQLLTLSLLGLGLFLAPQMEAKAETSIISSINIPSTTNEKSYNSSVSSIANTAQIKTTSTSDEAMGLAINDTDDITYIYEEPNVRSSILAVLPPNGVCEIIANDDLTNLDKFLSKNDENFVYIKSGDFEGYVLSKDISNSNLEDKIEKITYAITLSKTKAYKEADSESKVLYEIPKEVELEVLEYSNNNKFIKTSYKGKTVYIKTSVLDIQDFMTYAYKYEKSPSYKKANTEYKTREELEENIVEFATQFVGNKYVWGGNSLTNGIDCSGFTQAIYREFGYNLSRVVAGQVNEGTSVKESELRPGDLVFYKEDGRYSHVAMYIGDGKIVHASNSKPYPQGGIKISNYDCMTPVKFVRIIED